MLNLFETIVVCLSTKLGVRGTSLQDLLRQEVEDERHMDVLERVLKRGTTHPQRPQGKENGTFDWILERFCMTYNKTLIWIANKMETSNARSS